MSDRQNDWPPQGSAVDVPDGERRKGSTGQEFEARGGQWKRIETVRVGCRVPNGVMLQLTKPGFDDGAGVRPQIADGPAVRLSGPHPLHTGVGATAGAELEAGETEVDAGWWAKWIAQHAEDPLVKGGTVFEIEEREKTTENPPK